MSLKPESGDQIPAPGGKGTELAHPSIGSIFQRSATLSKGQIEEILAYQKLHKLRFGQAAVALKYASEEDVFHALSQQYGYPFASRGKGDVHDDLVVGLDPFGPSAEIFRDLRSQFIAGALSPSREKKALAVISQDVGDGKSYFSANIAISFSQLGATTLLIDADMRSPSLHNLFSLSADEGLSGILAGRLDVSGIQNVAQFPTLYLLPAGPTPPNPSELVQQGGFNLLMSELKSKFDFIIVDTPAASHGPDSRIIASCAGSAVVLARANKTNAKLANGFVHSLKRAGCEIAGVVFNRY